MPTLVHVSLAPLAVPAVRAPTDEIIDDVGALAAVLAGLLQALVDVLLTKAAPVAGQALAAEPVDLVQAAALIEAGVGGALVHVHFALGSIRPWLAVALNMKHKIIKCNRRYKT